MRSPIDWLVAIVVCLFAVSEELSGRSSLHGEGPSIWWVLAGLAAAVLVLNRRRAPFAVLFVYSAASILGLALVREMAAAWQFYTQLVLLFTLLSEVRPTSWKAAGGLAVTGAYIVSMVSASPTTTWGDVAVALVMAAIAGGAGLAVHRHRVLALQAEERGELLAQAAVAEERARIARELHDIVAHSVSVMTMQAGGVRLMLREEQDREREVLATIEETGREAVEELRRMLGLLRTPDPDDLAPQPSLDRLDDLVEHSRAAGLDVTVEVTGTPVPLAAGLGLSAYRIVQEALTNTLKHAGPTRAAVIIAYAPGELRLEITDDGPHDRPRDGRAPLTPGHSARITPARGIPGRTTPAPDVLAPDVPGQRTLGKDTSARGVPGWSKPGRGVPGRGVPERGGHGLLGMRERVALFHGTLAAGPLSPGGYRVRAVLPL
ncbi:sensor histidine kinase [Microtetraspora fusca]|uniref:sensor histidine kinase n=1 Tax=Microtetraspora fusca TaxID=1997 RepID=UPI00083387E2|nr:sensor histidine kinase [Microtetraspora fusca]